MAPLVTHRLFAHLISLCAFFPCIGIFSTFAAVIVVAPIIGIRSPVGLHVFPIFAVVAVDVFIGDYRSRKEKHAANKNHTVHFRINATNRPMTPHLFEIP